MFKPNWFSCALTLLGIFAAVSWHYEWHDLTIGSLGLIGGMILAVFLWMLMSEKPVILSFAKLRGIPPGSEFLHQGVYYRLLDNADYPIMSDIENEVRPSFHLRVGNLQTQELEFLHRDTDVLALTLGMEWPSGCACPRCGMAGKIDESCPLCKGHGKIHTPQRKFWYLLQKPGQRRE